MTPVMDIDALRAFLGDEFAQVAQDFLIEEVTPQGIILRLRVSEGHLRPGGTISGPTMMALADLAL